MSMYVRISMSMSMYGWYMCMLAFIHCYLYSSHVCCMMRIRACFCSYPLALSGAASIHCRESEMEIEPASTIDGRIGSSSGSAFAQYPPNWPQERDGGEWKPIKHVYRKMRADMKDSET